MAALSDQDRFDTWAEFMRRTDLGVIAISKSDLRAAVDALDQYFSDNAASINNTLPAAAKAGLTTTQKAILLMVVISKRYLTEV
jgi:hypothetical protein